MRPGQEAWPLWEVASVEVELEMVEFGEWLSEVDFGGEGWWK